MEDPWSTPWAVDTPSASPGLTPTKPKTPVAAAAPGGTGTITPVENGIGLGISVGFEHSPWGGATSHGFDAPSRSGTRAKDEEDEDGWGGWDDGKTNTWTGASGEKGIDVFKEPAEEFSAPWGFVDKEQQGEGVTDSAVSFGEQAREEEAKSIPVVEVRDEENKATVLLEDEQDAWTAPREEVAAPSAVIAPVPEAEHSEEPAVEAVEKPISEEEKETDIEQAEQQKSSKVQELVTMYDGFAKKAVRPPPSDTSAREGKPRGSADTSREDLTILEPVSKEDVVAEEEVDRKPKDMDVKSPVTDSESESSTEDEQSVDEDTIAEEDSATTEPTSITAYTTQKENADTDREPAPPSPKDEQLHAEKAKSNTKAPPYPIDFSNLDALFPGSQASTIRPEPVPDVIIDNSFTTAPERKTWYRISRLGSSRRHDSGDADNYKPLAWADSEVHGKTLQIVRHWMEQDSIAGRVVLGSRKAGPLGASMFNWDSSEPQIEISELLRQRVSNGGGGGGAGRHVRNRSLPQADAAPQTPTMEAFGGWGANASMPSTPSAVVQSPAFAAQMKAKSGSALRPPPDSPADSPAEMPKSPWDDEENKEEGRKSTDLMPPPSALAVPTVTVVNGSESTQDAPDEDDDDWGEMISSPAVEPSSTFAPLSAPADIKPTPLSQSFDADFSGLDFFESSAPAMTRPNAPPPIRTSGIASQNKPVVPSPIWTPTMNSPALEPIRVSMDSAPAKSPALASTPTLEPRASMSSSRLSMENAWAPTVSTPTTKTKSSMENEWTPMATPTATATLPVKQPASKRVSFEDTCTVDERTTIDEALRSLPDLSYMLR